MTPGPRVIRVVGHEVDTSGEVWKHPDPRYICLSLLPIEKPGGYPSPLGPLTLCLIRDSLARGLDDGSLGWATGVAYVTALGRLVTWLNATGRVSPGSSCEIADLELSAIRAFLAHVKATASRSQTTISLAALRWVYGQGLSQKAAGFREALLESIGSISYAGLGSPEEEGGLVPTWTLPAEPGLPEVPTSFKCRGNPARIDGLRMVCPGTPPVVGLERIIRPAGRPSALSRRAQQVALLFTVHEIQRAGWSRHQILNAVDRFAQWLAWHPEWRTAAERFEWSYLTPDLADSYFNAVREEPKGNDWWITLRGLYRWGSDQGLDGFDPAVERELLNVGRGRALTVARFRSVEEVRSRFAPDPKLPAIPPYFRTRDGKYVVSTKSPIWRQRDDEGNPHGTTVNIALLDEPPGGPEAAIYTRSFLHLVRLYMVRMASKRWSWGTLKEFIVMLRTLQAWLHTHRHWAPDSFDVEHLTPALISAHKTYLESDEGPGYSGLLSMLRRFYAWGERERLPGFDHQILTRLKEVGFRNSPKGELIRSIDPVRGAFSMTEQLTIQDALEDPDWGTVEEKALVKLCWYLGPRPVQIGALKAKHFERHVTPYGITYLLRLPRAKKRYATEETVPHSIPPEHGLGQLLEVLCPPGSDPERALFPSLAGVADTAMKLGSMLKRWAYRRGAHPLRTGRVLRDGEPDLLPINAYRFRRTAPPPNFGPLRG